MLRPDDAPLNAVGEEPSDEYIVDSTLETVVLNGMDAVDRSQRGVVTTNRQLRTRTPYLRPCVITIDTRPRRADECSTCCCCIIYVLLGLVIAGAFTVGAYAH